MKSTSFTIAALIAAVLMTPEQVQAEGFFHKIEGETPTEKLQWRPSEQSTSSDQEEVGQDYLNRMITQVANNAFEYFKDKYYTKTQNVENQFQEFKREQLKPITPIVRNVKQMAAQGVKKTSDWWAAGLKNDVNEEDNDEEYCDGDEATDQSGAADDDEVTWETLDDDYEGDDDINPLNILRTGACTLCRINIGWWQNWARAELFQMVMERVTDDFCYIGRFNLYYNNCKGFSRHFVPGLLDNLSELILTPDYFCPLMGFCEPNPIYEPITAENFVKEILSDKPNYLKGDDFIDNLYQEIRKDEEVRDTISVIQFTDIHLDLDYKVGSRTECNNMLCCRHSDGYSKDPKLQAGPYGSLAKCDIPPSVLFKMGDKINELAPDALFWTGDITPHDMWNQSVDHVIRYSDYLTNFLLSELPDWATYMIDGNHDFGELINSMDFRDGNRDPIIDHQAKTWKQWFTDESMAEFVQNGFYSQRFKTSNGKVHDKVRVLAINTEACYYYNLYLLAEMSDPGDQLQWLENTLAEMQENGEIAILIGHHPPGAFDCLSAWARRLNALIERYQDVVRLSFFGHIHEELFSSVRAQDSDRAINVNHWTAAMTTYSEKNTPAYPSFRRFILDEATMLPVRIETWLLDITQDDPEFFMHHEMGELYRMEDLSPGSFDKLTEQLYLDDNSAYIFERARNAFGPNPNLDSQCNDECREELFCQTRFSVHSDVRACLGKKEDGSFFDNPLLKMASMTSGVWLQGEL